MKKITAALLLMLPSMISFASGLQPLSSDSIPAAIVSDATETPNPFPPISQFFALDNTLRDHTMEKGDTLFIVCSTPQCWLIWHRDTISTEWTWDSPTNFIASLGPMGFANAFLMKTYAGDGCPFVYRLLEFKDDNHFFLSDSFGNCNEISSVLINWPEIEFQFPDESEIGRKSIRYIYNHNDYTLKEHP